MKFKLRSMDTGAQDQQKPIHHSQSSSTFSFFTGKPIPGGYSNDHFDGGRLGLDKFIGRFEMTEAIRRELEKERIREEIIAEEVARRRVLEAEVRHELMMSGGVFSSPFMRPSLPASHKNSVDPKILQHRQLIGQEEKVVMSVDGKHGRGCHLQEIRGFPVTSFQLLADSSKTKGIPMPPPEDNKKEVIVLDKPDDETLSGTKRKPPSPVPEGSSRHVLTDMSKKKVKSEWSCAVCQVSATSERGLTEHLKGKKHQAKEAALVAQKTGADFGLGVATKMPIIKPVNLALTTINLSSSEGTQPKRTKTRKKSVNQTPETCKPSTTSDPNDHKKKKYKFWCEMCRVGAFTETVMNAHKEGKKHSTRVVELHQKDYKVDSEGSATANSCEDKHETKTNQEVVVETVPAEV